MCGSVQGSRLYSIRRQQTRLILHCCEWGRGIVRDYCTFPFELLMKKNKKNISRGVGVYKLIIAITTANA